MARRKRPSDRRSPAPPPDSTPPSAGDSPSSPLNARSHDSARRRLERALQDALSFLEEDDDGGPTPLRQAQELADEANELTDNRERQRIAREALALSPDCVDAYVVLAESQKRPEEALRLYRQGEAAGRRLLGERYFLENAGHFWGLMETRPFMRACHGVAACLWATGQHNEAVLKSRELLRLNPNDNQGIRYQLCAFLAQLGRDKELEELLGEYDDVSAAWQYSQALLAFRRHGDSEVSRRTLKEAHETNRHVPELMLNPDRLPSLPPEYYSPGDENEAIGYVGENLASWRTTPGAIRWLRDVLQVRPDYDSPKPPPWKETRQELLELPQADLEKWCVVARPIPEFGSDEAEPAWSVAIVEDGSDDLVHLDFVTDSLSAKNVWASVESAMREPQSGDPRRPGTIAICNQDFFDTWNRRLADLDIELELHESLPSAEFALSAMSEMMNKMFIHQEGTPTDDDVRDLPQSEDEIWVADVRQLATWVSSDATPTRPWCIIIGCEGEQRAVLKHALSETMPEPTVMWDALKQAMTEPAMGDPRRPAHVVVLSADLFDACRQPLQSLGIRCTVADELPFLDELFDAFTTHLAGNAPLPPLLEIPDANFEVVAGVYDAASRFYRRAPWREVAMDAIVRVRCDRFPKPEWFAVVMGQSGMVLGIALYENLSALRRLIAGKVGPEDEDSQLDALGVHFVEAFEIPEAELAAIERHGWPIAGEDAYPIIVRFEPGGTFSGPVAWELELIEGVLRAVPDFLRQPHSRTPQAVTVASGDGELSLELTWVSR